ncbi:Rne/Rng family ribonuclease [Paenibacillus sp. MSJ-34]|uniref:Rne/Rng family ribonuclease n=1 Tax=Paenibacillus sp. MSJ-34 TaxID=2841529 RepID=UPI001C0F860B|nr:Rne/Rng family ribonuclease [Paenibacillus sp. MSJ-34]
MQQMVVHCERDKTQMALLEDGRLVEFAVERVQGKQLVGGFYKGRVVNVLPGMQAAFVDIGLKKNAFLYVDDVLHPHLEKQPKEKPSIDSLLDVGQELVVQVMKEPFGGKGARVTTHYSLPGRTIVYMPHADYVGVSKKIENETERGRLKVIGDHLRQPGEGLIMRTVAEGASRDAVADDLAHLREQWRRIEQRAETSPAPLEIHHDLSMVERLVRDIFTPQTEELFVDDKEIYGQIVSLLRNMEPLLVPRIRYYKEAEPIFQHFRIQEQLDRAFQRKIWLDNGAYLVLDHTEALTVIDVNTGKYIGNHDLEDTVFAANVEAAEEIARLVRLRDIGGIIIVDFIDMEQEEHRQYIIDRLEQLLKKDRTKCLVVGWTRLGLLEMTRKKVRDHVLYEPCAACRGTGRINA